MNRQKLLQPMIIIGVAYFLLVGCSPPLATIKTSLGDLKIVKVELSDRFPPGCSNPPKLGCEGVQKGYQILLVWLESASGNPKIFDDLFKAYIEAYVTADDGSTTKLARTGFVDQKPFILFTPPDTAHNFKLFWPDNPAIELGK